MTTELTHHIDGKSVKGTSGRFSDVFNPSKGEVASKCPLASKSVMEAAITVAEQAFPAWSQTSVVKRSRIMVKYLELCMAAKDELGELLSNEHGKVFEDAKGSVQRGIEVIEFAIGMPHAMKGEFSDNVATGITGNRILTSQTLQDTSNNIKRQEVRVGRIIKDKLTVVSKNRILAVIAFDDVTQTACAVSATDKDVISLITKDHVLTAFI